METSAFAHATDRIRFDQAARNRDAEREALIVAAILPQARRVNASVFELEVAVDRGVKAIESGRSRGFAIAVARRNLPRQVRVSTAGHTP